MTKEADRKSRKLIRKVVDKTARGGLVIVTGCYAEIDEERLRQIPGVNLVVKQSEKDKLVEKVLWEVASPDLKGRGRNDGITRFLRDSDNNVSEDSRLTSRSRVYLKIQDGCNNDCTYCIVPAARGRSRSVPPPAAEAKAKKLIAAGVKEIILTGINIGKYPDLPGLIDQLLTIHDLARLRLSSIEPEDVTPELVGLLGEVARQRTRRVNFITERPQDDASRLTSHASRLTSSYLCPHLHIPLQSGDDTILREMGADLYVGRIRSVSQTGEGLLSWRCDYYGCDCRVAGRNRRTFSKYDSVLERGQAGAVTCF